VLNHQHIDSSLQQLFNWYNSTRTSEPQCFIKKEMTNKSHLEEWEIRNSYKSNLPLEYDTLDIESTPTSAISLSIKPKLTLSTHHHAQPSTPPLSTKKIVHFVSFSNRTTSLRLIVSSRRSKVISITTAKARSTSTKTWQKTITEMILRGTSSPPHPASSNPTKTYFLPQMR
jgi:hypothetical protein